MIKKQRTKNIILIKKDKLLDINAVDAQYAIKKLVKNKAVSWDLIPGKVIKIH